MPYVSQLSQGNESTELVFATCSRYIESAGNCKLWLEIRAPLWDYLRQHCCTCLERDCSACFSEKFEENRELTNRRLSDDGAAGSPYSLASPSCRNFNLRFVVKTTTFMRDRQIFFVSGAREKKYSRQTNKTC